MIVPVSFLLGIRMSFQKQVVHRALWVAFFVGIILNIINQGEALLHFNFASVHFGQFLLTFFVPYIVSTYSSVRAKLNFTPGEVASSSVRLVCVSCSGVEVDVHRGDIVPFCSKCQKKTKWRVKHIHSTESQEELRRNFESIALFATFNPAPVLRFNRKGEILLSNPATNDIFHENLVGQDVQNFLPSLKAVNFQDFIGKAQIKSVIEEIDQKYFRFELRGIPDINAIQVYGADITEIFRTRLENQQLSTAIAQSSSLIMITNKKGEIEFVNQAFKEVTGYDTNEVLGKNPRFMKTNYHDREFYEEMWTTLQRGEVWEGEFLNRKKNGDTYWEESTIAPVRDDKGKIINYIAVKEDVTDARVAARALESMAMFAKLNPEPVFRFTKEFQIVESNDAAKELFTAIPEEESLLTGLLPELKDHNIDRIIEDNQVLTFIEKIAEHDYRFILRGIAEFGVCQIYGSDITERLLAQRKVEKQKEDITKSIEYAKRIQRAILPAESYIRKSFNDFFIYYKPRDIVSGDFYWLARKNKKTYLVVADCTGHGVPGAFMSLLGVAFLNEIVNKLKEPRANEILNELRRYIKKTLQSSEREYAPRDGMDMALCIFDEKNQNLQYSGAHNSLYLVRDGELIVYKADLMPVGQFIKDDRSFTNKEVPLLKNDMLFLYSDGFKDQFGGEKGKKYSGKRFKETLVQAAGMNVCDQFGLLDKSFKAWKKDHQQVDDVLVMGIRI